MGVSVYYTCERTNSLSHEEQQQVNAIINQYNDNFELKEIGETFCVYERVDSEPTIIFEGSTKLPFSDDFEDMLTALFHWLSCLTEIRRVIPEGEWRVHLDDIDAIWDEEDGWQMPMNEQL